MSDKKTCGCGHKHDGLECAGTEAAHENIVRQIDNGHWAVMGIFSDEGDPYHTFSVGLYENFDQPEIVIFGVHPQMAGRIINDIGERIARGFKLEAGRVYDDVLTGNYGALFMPVEKHQYDAYLGSALWYYQSDHFPVMQLVWPDPNGKFPWEDGFDPYYASAQPLIGLIPENAAELHGRVEPPESPQSPASPSGKA